ncbi:uncharacterized protein H6S33_005609 [Morchella sextelata]|uniref:uncharacterized protein n=1 Tax=Morchella sextelata TaxID=1174677 RepID=UPI001D04111D|nr:uncharacterized protein H6S33_005609 [Morchella sextelata]KAH0613723.1 hypothetical protein H6S33_005609 [Morchella sextelata]
MNQYDDEEWIMPPSLSYHASLDSHHPIEHHTYPSQHISHPTSAVLEQPLTVLSSPSFSQDRERDLQDEESHSVPVLPSYQISHQTLSHIPPTPPPHTPSNPFKRPYQPDPTPASSPGHQNSQIPNPKRRKSTSKEAWTMTEDDNLLLKLKDEEGLPWKAIAQKFRDMNRGEFRVPTLQMRYKRLKEKMRVWDLEDVQLLKEAKDYLEKQKWELISQKMLELGCKKKIPASTCEKKWKEIAPQQPQAAQTSPIQCHDMKREQSHSSDEGFSLNDREGL